MLFDFLFHNSRFEKKLKKLSVNNSGISIIDNIDNVYINLVYGILLQKTNSWFFAREDEIYKGLTDTRFTFDQTRDFLNNNISYIDDPEVHEIRKQYDKVCDEVREICSKETPLTVISKEQLDNSANTFTPGITFFLGEQNIPIDFHFKDNVYEELNLYSNFLPNFISLQKPKKFKISGFFAYKYYANFDFVHENLEYPVPVRVLIVSIRHNEHLYDLKLYDAPDNGINYKKEYKRFLKNIILRKFK
ncbi:hypothetical protein [Spirochaeta cellobiosiphila]|uniref:hypothetical protein n=1 Tax=Spirochaeta cellobiosiphila TaxID=504483 RepID=UPI000405EBC5|nr:hypothetical protein [Spirochaeta cellobiosiphila]